MCGGREVRRVGIIGAAMGSLAGGAVNAPPRADGGGMRAEDYD